MTINEFCKNLKQIYNNYFPQSSINVSYENNLYRSIHMKLYLIKDKSEAINNILLNDMFHITFSIDNDGKEFQKHTTIECNVPELLCMTTHYNSYTTIPTNNYCVYGSNKVSFRKVSGDYNKILKSFDNYCKKLKDSIKLDYETNKIHDHFKNIVQQKVIDI